MKDELVTFETAKLAKEKKFDYNSPYFYRSYNKENPEWSLEHQYKIGCILSNLEPVSNKLFDVLLNENLSGGYYIYTYAISVPSQSLLQKWLRNLHNIHIDINREEDDWKYELYDFKSGNKHIPRGFKTYNSYELALEAGLFEALKLINVK